jgi:hypothetical protein
MEMNGWVDGSMDRWPVWPWYILVEIVGLKEGNKKRGSEEKKECCPSMESNHVPPFSFRGKDDAFRVL